MDSTENSYIMLQKQSQETCDFCDRTFKNRFDSIIHNASHIIIPLIKQECHQCDVCLHYFALREDLDSHHETKHATLAINSLNNKTLNTKIKFENNSQSNTTFINKIKFEISNELTYNRNDYNLELESKRRANIYNDAISNLKEDISSNFGNYNCIEKTGIKPEKRKNDLEVKRELINDEDLENDDGLLLTENEQEHERSYSIKNRLRFEGEDDLVDTEILSDLVTDVAVNILNGPINQIPDFKNLNSQNTKSNRTILNGSSYTQTALSNNMQLKVSNYYNVQAIQHRSVQPVSNGNISELGIYEKNRQNVQNQLSVLEKFTVESNNPLTLIDDLEYNNFVIRNIQKVEQHDETDLLVNHIRKIDKSNITELLEPVSNSLPVSDSLLEPVSNSLPVSDSLLEPVSNSLPVSDSLLEPVSDSLLEPEYNSVHYSELIKPGVFKCKYCSKIFTNRLLLVQHEPAHMRARQPRPLLCTYCDVYVAGHHYGLRRHIARVHPGASPGKKHATHRCQKCGLKFRKYVLHVRNYHPRECHGCGKEHSENEPTKLQEHLPSCTIQNVSSKMLNVCEMCYTFIKAKMNIKYIFMGTTEYLPGVRYPCSMCGKERFELKKIKRVLYGASFMQGFGKKKTENRMKRPMSNEERLKKFQHRLKKINFLNKF